MPKNRDLGQSHVYINKPLKDGILIGRNEQGEVETNVPVSCLHHSPSGFEYGYGGSGPADLALNLVEAVLREEGYTGRETTLHKGKCLDMAWAIHQEFKWVWIASMNKGTNYTMSYEGVKKWIDDQVIGRQ